MRENGDLWEMMKIYGFDGDFWEIMVIYGG